MTKENISLIIQICTLGGFAFAIYKNWAKPQEEVNEKAILLAQQLETDKKETERRFTEITGLVVNLRDNHLHTLQDNLDKHIINQQSRNEEFSNSLTKIATILEERLPKKP